MDFFALKNIDNIYVIFYVLETYNILGDRYGWELYYQGNDILEISKNIDSKVSFEVLINNFNLSG